MGKIKVKFTDIPDDAQASILALVKTSDYVKANLLTITGVSAKEYQVNVTIVTPAPVITAGVLGQLSITKNDIIPLDSYAGTDNYGKLVDGNFGIDSTLAYQPINSNNPLSYPHHLLMKLNTSYTMDSIQYYDRGDFSVVKLFVGTTPFNLTQVGSDITMNNYGAWKTITLANTNIAYVMLVLVTTLGRFPSEIKVFGTRTGAVYTPPTPVALTYPVFASVIGTDCQPGGNDPAKITNAASVARMYIDAAYFTKLKSGVKSYRFDNPYRGGANNANIIAYKTNGVKAHMCMQYSPEWILNRNDFTTDFSGTDTTSAIGTGFNQVVGTWGISSNEGYCSSAINTGNSITNIVLSTTLKTDQYQKFKTSVHLVTSTDVIRVITRYSDINNYFYVEIKGDNTSRLWKRVAGVETAVGNSLTGTTFVGNTVTVLLIPGNGDFQYIIGETQYGGYFSDGFNNNSSAVNFGIGIVSGAGIDGTQVKFGSAIHDNDFKPCFWNADSYLPESYREYAKYMYIITAMFGNGTIDPTTLPLDTVAEYTHVQPVVANLNLVNTIEPWNEQNKDWQSFYGYWHPYQYAAMISAVYDGNGNTMGSGVGIKNADPNMKVSSAGLIGIDKSYYEAINEWSKYNRTDQKLPFDIINMHHYCNDGSGQFQSTTGIMPEGKNNDFFNKLQDVMLWKRTFHPTLSFIISEIGYDTNTPSSQVAPTFAGYDNENSQGILLIRTWLIAAAAGIDGCWNFTFSDNSGVSNSSSGQYIKSGIIASDTYNNVNKASWYYVSELFLLFKGTQFKCISYNLTGGVYVVNFKDLTSGNVCMFYWSPTQNGTSVANQTIAKPTGTFSSAKKYVMNGTTVKTQTVISNTANIIDTINENPSVYYYIV